MACFLITPGARRLFLAALGAEGRRLLGIDIALRWLLVARKRLDEEGLGHVRLACACAERLPLADQTVSGVVAGDVIEHVVDQSATLAEAHRVLAALRRPSCEPVDREADVARDDSHAAASCRAREPCATPGLGRRIRYPRPA